MSKSIMQNKKECYITNATTNLHKHHIYFGSSNRKISEKYGFWIWLQDWLHNTSSAGIHFDREFDLRIKRECQEKFEKTHSREEFIKLIGKNYL